MSGTSEHWVVWRMMVLSMDSREGFGVYHYVPDQTSPTKEPTTVCGLTVPGRWARFEIRAFLRDARYEVAAKVWNHGSWENIFEKTVCATCRASEEFRAETTAAILLLGA